MIRDFDVFVEEHLQEVLCQAEKEQALTFVRKASAAMHASVRPEPLHYPDTTEIQLQDCAISPSFSHNHL